VRTAPNVHARGSYLRTKVACGHCGRLQGIIPTTTDGMEAALEMGMDWSLREGYAWAEDKEHCEEYGRMLSANANKVLVPPMLPFLPLKKHAAACTTPHPARVRS